MFGFRNRITTVRSIRVDENNIPSIPGGNPTFYYPMEDRMPQPDDVYQQQPPKLAPPAPMMAIPRTGAAPVATIPAAQIPPGTVIAAPLPLPQMIIPKFDLLLATSSATGCIKSG